MANIESWKRPQKGVFTSKKYKCHLLKKKKGSSKYRLTFTVYAPFRHQIQYRSTIIVFSTDRVAVAVSQEKWIRTTRALILF